MYYKIKELISKGFSKARISRELGISRKTLYHYFSMPEKEFLQWADKVYSKPQKLYAYEELISGWLKKDNDLSAYQVHDWLLEHVPELNVTRRTVSSYVMGIRKRHHIPKPPVSKRDFVQVPEQPYGKQAQVDFGEFNMITEGETRRKVYFFGMVLSRSRHKFFHFQLSPFTALDTVRAHEEAFEYFGGIPQQIVYDQDKVLLVDENKGELILTEAFRAYVTQRRFSTYFCRKADPQSKGKVENIIKYIKTNFLKNRKFTEIGLLNRQAKAWLERTGNGAIHGSTHKIPAEELKAEQPHLAQFFPLDQSKAPLKSYRLRKDNTISFKGNFYSVPQGTYQGQGTEVLVSIEEEELVIYDQNRQEIAKHLVCLEKGKLISNSHHRRSNTHKINELITIAEAHFSNPNMARGYFEQIRELKPRYIRDQIQMIIDYSKSAPVSINDQVLDFCLTNNIFSARDFGAVITSLGGEQPLQTIPSPDLLHKDIDRSQYNQVPQQSNIDTYETIISNN